MARLPATAPRPAPLGAGPHLRHLSARSPPIPSHVRKSTSRGTAPARSAYRSLPLSRSPRSPGPAHSTTAVTCRTGAAPCLRARQPCTSAISPPGSHRPSPWSGWTRPVERGHRYPRRPGDQVRGSASPRHQGRRRRPPRTPEPSAVCLPSPAPTSASFSSAVPESGDAPPSGPAFPATALPAPASAAPFGRATVFPASGRPVPVSSALAPPGLTSFTSPGSAAPPSPAAPAPRSESPVLPPPLSSSAPPSSTNPGSQSSSSSRRRTVAPSWHRTPMVLRVTRWMRR
ncbi:hypothetical protein SDIAM26S_01829 [Streptomyces diastaticus subsp. diastaticus]